MKTLLAKNGFTLVEVLMASVILVISLGGMLSLFFYCFNLNERSREYSVAISEVQNRLEEIHWSGATGAAGPFPLTQLTGSGFVYVRTSPVYSNPELLEVKVVISWQSPKDGHIIGEDRNFNGVLDEGEDLNANSELDSPIMFSALLASRY